MAVTRHGSTIGYFIPARGDRGDLDGAALTEEAGKMDAMLERVKFGGKFGGACGGVRAPGVEEAGMRHWGRDRLLVLDASIILRAVLGTRVRTLIERYAIEVAMCTPAICVSEVQAYLASLRGPDEEAAANLIRALLDLVSPMSEGLYLEFEEAAKARCGLRAEQDWPVVALALALNADIWTESAELVETGLAVWTTETVEVFLNDDPRSINEVSLEYCGAWKSLKELIVGARRGSL